MEGGQAYKQTNILILRINCTRRQLREKLLINNVKKTPLLGASLERVNYLVVISVNSDRSQFAINCKIKIISPKYFLVLTFRSVYMLPMQQR